MAVEYAKVLRAKNITPITVGRGEQSAHKFLSETGFAAEIGGLDAWLARKPIACPTHAIVAVGEKTVGTATLALLEQRFKSILVEKPGGFDAADIRAVGDKAKTSGSAVSVGYNRRFFSSTIAAQKIIAEDGGVQSFNFEFTEWGHVIAGLAKEEGVKRNGFYPIPRMSSIWPFILAECRPNFPHSSPAVLTGIPGVGICRGRSAEMARSFLTRQIGQRLGDGESKF